MAAKKKSTASKQPQPAKIADDECGIAHLRFPHAPDVKVLGYLLNHPQLDNPIRDQWLTLAILPEQVEQLGLELVARNSHEQTLFEDHGYHVPVAGSKPERHDTPASAPPDEPQPHGAFIAIGDRVWAEYAGDHNVWSTVESMTAEGCLVRPEEPEHEVEDTDPLFFAIWENIYVKATGPAKGAGPASQGLASVLKPGMRAHCEIFDGNFADVTIEKVNPDAIVVRLDDCDVREDRSKPDVAPKYQAKLPEDVAVWCSELAGMGEATTQPTTTQSLASALADCPCCVEDDHQGGGGFTSGIIHRITTGRVIAKSDRDEEPCERPLGSIYVHLNDLFDHLAERHVTLPAASDASTSDADPYYLLSVAMQELEQRIGQVVEEHGRFDIPRFQGAMSEALACVLDASNAISMDWAREHRGAAAERAEVTV